MLAQTDEMEIPGFLRVTAEQVAERVRNWQPPVSAAPSFAPPPKPAPVELSPEDALREQAKKVASRNKLERYYDAKREQDAADKAMSESIMACGHRIRITPSKYQRILNELPTEKHRAIFRDKCRYIPGLAGKPEPAAPAKKKTAPGRKKTAKPVYEGLRRSGV